MARRPLASSLLGRLRPHLALLGLLAADVVTKTASFALLEQGSPYHVFPGVTLYLALNEWGVMGGVAGLGAVTANTAYTFGLAVGLFVLAAVVAALSRTRFPFAVRCTLGVASFLAVAEGARLFGERWTGAAFEPHAVVYGVRAASLAVCVTLYGASRSTWPRAAFALLAAGALGNALSYLYPPFGVVDFLLVPVAPVLLALGAEGHDETFGVINLADLYVVGFALAVVLWPLAAALRRVPLARLGFGR